MPRKCFPKPFSAVHLDHGDEQTCYDCIDSGFYSSVMIDASHDPFEENVAITKRVVDRAHAKGISVEAEIGQLGGVEEDIQVDEKNANLTDPDEAEAFVKQSGCDSLAVAIGTSHGAYKFSGGQGLHFNRIEEIAKRMPGFPLVMHGSSSVPQEEVRRINAAGGQLAEGAKGVDENEYLPRRQIGRHQSQRRYRWPFGVDTRSPRIFPRSSRRLRFARAGQNLHPSLRRFHRAQK